jgi:hypothetical protein
METVRDETGFEGVPRHALDISGIASTFETMEKNDLSQRISRRVLRLNQNLGIRIGPNMTVRHGITRKVVVTRPEVSENREEVRIAEERFERPHST